jgi:hypothetical protein
MISALAILAMASMIGTSALHARAASTDSVVLTASDPVGNYTWNFDTGDGGKITGTMVISKPATGYAAKLTSDRTEGELAAKSVSVDGNHVVVVVVGEFGEFTMDMTMKDPAIEATWKLVANGETQQGPLNVERAKK